LNHVAEDAEKTSPLNVGEKIPNLTYQTIENKEFNLNQSLTQKPAILIYYRGEWCYFCNLQFSELSKIEGQLMEMGYQVLAVSPDIPEFLKKTSDRHTLKSTLLSDSHLKAAKALGIVFALDEKTKAYYAKKGFELEKHADDSSQQLPVPSVFIIDKQGVVRYVFSEPNYKIRIASDVLLKAAANALVH